MKHTSAIILVALLTLGLIGCAASNREKGAVIGGATGAVIGGVIGNEAGNTAVGAILGAVVGGAAGAVIGDYMDRQAEELEEDLEGARVERIGEGIKITFESGLLFPVNGAQLTPQAQAELNDLARILKKYDDTNIIIEGHTDDTGTESYNQDLSERRAENVARQLAVQNVIRGRMSVVGYGETQPIAGNSTPTGRQANRRVEVAIIANDELKDAARERVAG